MYYFLIVLMFFLIGLAIGLRKCEELAAQIKKKNSEIRKLKKIIENYEIEVTK